MPLFQITGNALMPLSAMPIDSEKVLQRRMEANLNILLNVNLLISEYPIPGGRIDSLGIDNAGAPVIVEYKRFKTDNVINQALYYLSWLTMQPQELFEKLMKKYLSEDVFKNIKLDWKNPRIICVSDTFNKFDLATVKMVPLRIDLFEYREYQNDILSIEPVACNEMQKNLVNANRLMPFEMAEMAIQTMKAQTSDAHQVSTFFDCLREKILALNRYIVETPNKKGFSYRLSNIFADVLIRKQRLVINLRPIDYEDPRGRVEKIYAEYTVTLNRRLTLSSAEDIDYAIFIIEQSYKNVQWHASKITKCH